MNVYLALARSEYQTEEEALRRLEPAGAADEGGVADADHTAVGLGLAQRLITQMYFEGDPYNKTDRFLQAAGRTELLVTKLLPPTAEMEPESKLVVFDIVLNVG